MDKSLQALRSAVKKIIWQLKPQTNALSFLVLTGKVNQGKTTLLRQSQLQHLTIDAELSAEIYYNQHGLIIELGEAWLTQSKILLQQTLKQLNRCHRTVKISGLILCIDLNELLIPDPIEFAAQAKSHGQLLQRFGISLGYRVDAAIIFTKLDALAGFCEFFQYEHAANLQKPLGFSLYTANQQNRLLDAYKAQFDHLAEMLGQQVIHKMHPARSSLKRTLIREFPLQLASLRTPIQAVIQNIPPRLFRLDAIYFTSAEQGGISLDRLNKKIQHEYALTVQDKFPQSVNYRAYFIEEALSAFQIQTKRQPSSIPLPNKWVMGAVAAGTFLPLVWMGYQHFKSANLLDEASKQLLMYETLINQSSNNAPALYHLVKAANSLDKIASSTSTSTIKLLKTQLHTNTYQHLHGNFLPSVLADLEQTMMDSRQSHSARYQALKIYLMLGDSQKFSESDVVHWFQQHWKNEPPNELPKKISLLNQALGQPLQPIPLNQQYVTDVRNYLNALPPSYLYYSLAKESFPQEKTAVAVPGFELADKDVPGYFTKAGFQQVMGSLGTISSQLKLDNWILARQDLGDLQGLLQQAYCYEYATWWQNFMRRSHPQHFQNYTQAHGLAEILHQSNSINTMIELIQQQTSPEFGENSKIFNQEIASKFTTLSLVSHTAALDLNLNIMELDKFLMTLSVTQDQGKTAFDMARSRFIGDTLSNPLSTMYARAQQLPEPVSLWIKQVADDAWFLLINDSRAFINRQWQTVFQEYQNQIAHRYPFDSAQAQEVTLTDFDHFFSTHGVLNKFLEFYLKPFLDTSKPQWQLKELNNFVLPISADTINELIRANVITNMFFPLQSDTTKIEFSLQKVSLDPVVANLEFNLGETKLYDDQNTDSYTRFIWPQANAKLSLNSIEGNHYELDETGPWAFFKMLQKVNVLVDEHDSASLQIIFEVNGNSGRYLLKTQNQINPFIPGILNGFTLTEAIV
jgi:intracellular multiplication protein IcmF